MSGRLLRLVCTVAVTASVVLAPGRAAAEPAPGERPLPELLTDLSELYRGAERATETYNATAERLTRQRAESRRLDERLAKARRSLDDGRGAAGRLARQQYQGVSGISPYVRLLLARDPQRMLDEGHVVGRLARERAEAVTRLSGGERRADALAHAARRALDRQRSLTEQRKKDRDTVRSRLGEVERMLASLSPARLAELTRLEQERTAAAQEELLASGAVRDDERPPSPAAGRAALRPRTDRQALRMGGGRTGLLRLLGADLEGVAGGRPADPPHQPGAVGPPPARPAGRAAPRRPGALPPRRHARGALHGPRHGGAGPRPGAAVTMTPLATAPVLGAVRPGAAL